jgi:cell division protein FtsB
MSQPERQWSASPTQLATIILAIFALYLFASAVSRAINIVDLKRQQATLQETQRGLRQTIASLQAEIQYLQSDSFLEQEARETQLLGRPGDTLVIPLESAPQAAPTPVPLRRP